MLFKDLPLSAQLSNPSSFLIPTLSTRETSNEENFQKLPLPHQHLEPYTSPSPAICILAPTFSCLVKDTDPGNASSLPLIGRFLSFLLNNFYQFKKKTVFFYLKHNKTNTLCSSFLLQILPLSIYSIIFIKTNSDLYIDKSTVNSQSSSSFT